MGGFRIDGQCLVPHVSQIQRFAILSSNRAVMAFRERDVHNDVFHFLAVLKNMGHADVHVAEIERREEYGPGDCSGLCVAPRHERIFVTCRMCNMIASYSIPGLHLLEKVETLDITSNPVWFHEQLYCLSTTRSSTSNKIFIFDDALSQRECVSVYLNQFLRVSGAFEVGTQEFYLGVREQSLHDSFVQVLSRSGQPLRQIATGMRWSLPIRMACEESRLLFFGIGMNKVGNTIACSSTQEDPFQSWDYSDDDTVWVDMCFYSGKLHLLSQCGTWLVLQPYARAVPPLSRLCLEALQQSTEQYFQQYPIQTEIHKALMQPYLTQLCEVGIKPSLAENIAAVMATARECVTLDKLWFSLSKGNAQSPASLMTYICNRSGVVEESGCIWMTIDAGRDASWRLNGYYKFPQLVAERHACFPTSRTLMRYLFVDNDGNGRLA